MRVLVFLLVGAMFLVWLGFALRPSRPRAAALAFGVAAAAVLLAAAGFYRWV